jgi:hypothetical protein
MDKVRLAVRAIFLLSLSFRAIDLGTGWSEPLRVDNELSEINSWREVYEKDEAALRPSIQDISSS